MIMTLKVTLVRGMYCEGDWTANIELEESSTLEDLHRAVQEAVKFNDDHLYSFFVSRTDRSRSRDYFDDENGLIFTTIVGDMFPLPKDRYLFYLFDWRYEWVFKISPSRKRPHEPLQGVKYPRVESESGVKPLQYPHYEDDDE